jgi:coenzyme F420-reducing hydrogenase beta subunit
VFLRPSCYRCPFAIGERASDITLGDCWRVAASHPQYDDNQGTSLLLVNTEKGHKMMAQAADRLVCHDYDFELARKRNHTLHAPSIESGRREAFFSNYKQHKNFELASSEYYKPLSIMRKKAEWILKRLLWPLLRRFQ